MTFKVKLVKAKLKGVTRQPGRVLSLLLSLLILTACPAPGPNCVDADEWGQTEDITVKIDPTKQLNPSGISVTQGAPLTLDISGHIDLCPSQDVINATSAYPVSASVYGWQDSGKHVTVGDKLEITISQSYTDREGVHNDGSGLYAYIYDSSSPLPGALDPSKTIANGGMKDDDWWYGQSGSNLPSSNRVAVDQSGACHPMPGTTPTANPDGTSNIQCNPFFELWDNGTVGSGGSGYVGVAPASGELYFRYARTANSRGTSNTGDDDDRHSPWKGAFRWVGDTASGHGSACDACRQTSIMLGCVGATAFYGICVAIAEGACAGQNELEYAISDSKYRNSRCQEWYASDPTGGYWGAQGFDHWVDENADTSNYNAGGSYDISISSGCPGMAGKFMQMDIGSSTTTMVPVQPDASGNCPSGSQGMTGVGCVSTAMDDSLGEVITEPQFSVSPTTTGHPPAGCDLNSSGFDENGTPIPLPANFTRRGHYETTSFPYSGELWFEVVDGPNEKTPTGPGAAGSYYPDNIGSYTVHLVTTKSDTSISSVLNGLVTPMRKIIFGYCRIDDSTGTVDPSTVANTTTEANCFPKTYVDTQGVTHPGAWQQGITQKMYGQLIGSSIFIRAVQAGMVLMIVIYGMFFMMGMVKDAQEDFIKKVIKVAIITQLISPGSWTFFNQYLFTFFIDGMNQLISAMAGDFMGAVSMPGVTVNMTNPFAFIDGTMSKFLNLATFAKLLGLVFIFPMGIMYIFIILTGMFYFLYAVLRATILYILAMLCISLLLAVGPIFIAFMMFSKTKHYFDSWTKSLINYLFQPVLVFTALAIFNVFVYSAIYTLLHYGVCWTTIFSLPGISFGTLGSLPSIPLFKFYTPSGGHDGDPLLSSGMPINLFMVLIFIIITNAMLKFVDFMADVAVKLSGGGTSLSKHAGSTLSSGIGIAKGAAGMALGAVGKAGGAAKNAIVGGGGKDDGGDKKETTPRK